ncbi:hypothetical protein C5167_010605 [Papaver somniferum]|uniref:Uncharacterized protein n=1 Tax=Papaver somniferum TaxID=3469 RepID=A0A4Y7K1Y0_PAPSO|nr:hypothetical protein C5167_010605 [Papaver somniferum]
MGKKDHFEIWSTRKYQPVTIFTAHVDAMLNFKGVQ